MKVMRDRVDDERNHGIMELVALFCWVSCMIRLVFVSSRGGGGGHT